MKKILFKTFLRYTPYWDYKPTNAYHADGPRVYTSDKNLNLGTIDENRLKSECFNGFNLILLNEPAGLKVFCKPETVLYKKLNISVLNTITFYLEDNSNEVVNLNAETLTSFWQLMKI